jgi:DNA-binding beta-propeller fold protein YncE
MLHPYFLRLAALLGLLALATTVRAQNVGIGTTSPTQTLDVNGTLRVRAAAGSGDGRLLGVAADGTLQAQSAPFGATATATSQPTANLSTVPTGDSPFSVAVNPAGTRAFVVNFSSSTLQTFDLTSNSPTSLGTTPTGYGPFSVAVNPAGTRAYVVSITGSTLQTYDLTGSLPVSLGTTPTGTRPFSVAVNPAGTRAYVANYNDNTLQTFDLTGSSPTSLGTTPTGYGPFSVAVNPAGTRAYVVNYDGNTLQTYDLTDNSPTSLGTVPAGTNPRGVSLNPAGTRAYVVSYGDNTLQTFDLTGGLPNSLGTVPTGANPFSVAVSPAGTRAYVVNYNDNTLQTYDLTGSSPTSLGTTSTGANPRSVAVNPAGTRAYAVNTSSSSLQTFIIGSSPRLVVVGANGTLGSVDPATLPGDNLGNHQATRQLVLASQGLQFSDGTTQATAPVLTLSGQRLGISGSNSVTLPTPAGDNLGNHTASQNLDLAAYQLVGQGGSQGLSLTSTGNAGIGTATPGQKLEVAGQVFSSSGGFRFPDNSVQTTAAVAATGASFVQNGTAPQASASFNVAGSGTVGGALSAGSLNVGSNGTVGGTLQLNSGDQDKIYLTSQGAAGSKLGHASGWGLLSYAGPGTGSQGYQAWLLSGASAYQEGMRLTVNGLGIGTPSPRQKLEVAGQVYSSAGGFRFPDNSVQATAATGANFIQSGTTQQANASFNISGSATVGGALSAGSATLAGPVTFTSAATDKIYLTAAGAAGPKLAGTSTGNLSFYTGTETDRASNNSFSWFVSNRSSIVEQMQLSNGLLSVGISSPTMLALNGSLRLAVRVCPVNQTTDYTLTSDDLDYSIFKVQNFAFAPSLTLPAFGREGQELTIITTASTAMLINGTNTDNPAAAITLPSINSNGQHAVKYVWALAQNGAGYWVRVQ